MDAWSKQESLPKHDDPIYMFKALYWMDNHLITSISVTSSMIRKTLIPEFEWAARIKPYFGVFSGIVLGFNLSPVDLDHTLKSTR